MPSRLHHHSPADPPHRPLGYTNTHTHTHRAGRHALLRARITAPCRPALRVLYNVQLGFYVSSIGMILCWEVRRKDFAAMFTHHLLTLGLIVASWRLRCGPPHAC